MGGKGYWLKGKISDYYYVKSIGEDRGPKGLMICVMVKEMRNDKQRDLLHYAKERWRVQ